jgi:hypothetical protein
MKKNFTLMLSLCCFLFSNTKAQTSTVNGVVKSQIDNNGNIFTNGKIAIGTFDTSKIGSYSLAVNGDAIFNKVKVKLYSGWSDYVFYKHYQLLPLKDLEVFIKTNYHLPDVPSATEVEKNGIDVAGNQALLLKKVEELTLYIIELNKKNEQQQQEIDKMKIELDRLKNL